jgi:sRNA-binding regulator protein Hfq
MTAVAPLITNGKPATASNHKRGKSSQPALTSYRQSAYSTEQEVTQRQAELFYLQKQIQAQTPMVLVLEDGEVIEGCIEWYDRNVLKVRGRAKTLIYKTAIKYMYKQGDAGQ